MPKELPPPELLRKLLRYDPISGDLFWLPRDTSCGYEQKHCDTFNKQFSGKKALHAINAQGYRHGAIFNKFYRAHRVVWSLFYQSLPPDEIDHINGIRHDNRICNLRTSCRSSNMKNCGIRADNKSGNVGVFWDKQRCLWRAEIKSFGKSKYIGRFKSIHAAIAARNAAELELGFHEGHGEKRNYSKLLD
jgi:hypothetical protein